MNANIIFERKKMKQESPFVDIISLDNGEVFTTHEGRVGRVLGKRRDGWVAVRFRDRKYTSRRSYDLIQNSSEMVQRIGLEHFLQASE